MLSVRPAKSRGGFTLLEILVAMAILAFVSIFTAQSIQTALKNRAKIQGEIDEVSALRDALKIMENDINHAFNHKDINISLYNETAKAWNKKIEEAKAKAQGGAPKQPQPDAPKHGDPTSNPTTDPLPPGADPYANLEPMRLRTEVILTHFVGTPEKLDFTSLSNVRISSEERTSDQAEIGYSLKSCRSRSDREKSSQCLIRRVSTLIDDNIEEGGEETPLLENVTKLEFRYLGFVSPTEWVKDWYSNERGDERTRNAFPYAVEVTIEVQDKNSEKKSKPLRMTLVAAIRNPNNPQKKEEGAADATGSGQPAGQPGGP